MNRLSWPCKSPRVQSIGSLQVFLGFAAANQPEAVAFDYHLRRPTSRIVIGRQRHSIGASSPNRKQVSRLHFPKRPVVQKAITRLAHGTNDVRALPLGPLFPTVARLFADRKNRDEDLYPHQCINI